MKIAADQLEMLAVIVAAGSVSRGASELGKTQPSVSRSIKLLEARIGEPLFVPGRRPLQPTELCRLLAAQGRTIVEAGRAANHTLAQFRQGRSGVVRLGGTPFFMDGVIAGMTAELQKAHPQVGVHQDYAYVPELKLRLTNGAIDLAVCPMVPDEIAPPFSFRRLLRGRNVIACRADHPLTRRAGVRPEDIAHYPWVAPPAGSPLLKDLEATCAALGVGDISISATGGSLGSVLSMTAASDALTVLPVSVVFAMRHTFALAVVSVRIDHPERDLGILTLADASPSPAVRRYVRFLAERVAGLQSTIEHFERTAAWRA